MVYLNKYGEIEDERCPKCGVLMGQEEGTCSQCGYIFNTSFGMSKEPIVTSTPPIAIVNLEEDQNTNQKSSIDWGALTGHVLIWLALFLGNLFECIKKIVGLVLKIAGKLFQANIHIFLKIAIVIPIIIIILSAGIYFLLVCLPVLIIYSIYKTSMEVPFK